MVRFVESANMSSFMFFFSIHKSEMLPQSLVGATLAQHSYDQILHNGLCHAGQSLGTLAESLREVGKYTNMLSSNTTTYIHIYKYIVINTYAVKSHLRLIEIFFAQLQLVHLCGGKMDGGFTLRSPARRPSAGPGRSTTVVILSGLKDRLALIYGVTKYYVIYRI